MIRMWDSIMLITQHYVFVQIDLITDLILMATFNNRHFNALCSSNNMDRKRVQIKHDLESGSGPWIYPPFAEDKTNGNQQLNSHTYAQYSCE